MEEFRFSAIGYLRNGGALYKFETPRQSVFSENQAVIELNEELKLVDGLSDLSGFERIWVTFVFHLNLAKGWKSKVRPPLSKDDGVYGVFATRSPYRPNPIGLSCLELLKVEKNRIYVKNCDLLDMTPILDIKPYIPEADSFPEAKCGWREDLEYLEFKLSFTERMLEKAEFLRKNSMLDAVNFAKVQLKFNPIDRKKKRIKMVSGVKNLYTIGYRTWKLLFYADIEAHAVEVKDLFSNYSMEDFASIDDKYSDKDLHRKFLSRFPIDEKIPD